MASQLLPVSVTTGQKRPSESEPNPSERPEKQPRIETPTTSNEASCKNDIESKDADRLRRLRSVNRSVMSMFDGALKKDPGADLSTLLESYAQIYPGRRKKAEERALKAPVTLPPQQEPTTLNVRPENAATPITPKVSCDPKNPRLSPEAKHMLKVPSGILKVIKPLAPSVLALFHNSNSDNASTEPSESPHKESFESLLPQELARILSQGEILQHSPGRVVVKLSETVVVKLGINIDLGQVDVMSYIKQHTKKTPVPEPLGVLTIEKISYIFMLFVEGTTLEKRWPRMKNEEKFTVQKQLSAIMEELRQIPSPAPGSSLGWNDRCKDTRHRTRWGGLIASEAEFNEFLLSNPLPRITKAYLEMIRSRLRDDHRIVLTHGDLHPRNIMVVDGLKITGLIDWEMSGWYPEYWEYLKALNTSPTIRSEEDDWWRYLPQSIGIYHTEWALDRQLETIVHC